MVAHWQVLWANFFALTAVDASGRPVGFTVLGLHGASTSMEKTWSHFAEHVGIIQGLKTAWNVDASRARHTVLTCRASYSKQTMEGIPHVGDDGLFFLRKAVWKGGVGRMDVGLDVVHIIHTRKNHGHFLVV